MKQIVCLIMAGIFMLLAGCASVDKSVTSSQTGGDGIIHQKTEFKDLSAREQEIILYEGGGS